MNYKNIVRITLVLFFVVAGFSKIVLAEDPHFLSAYHSEYGLKLYNDGKIDFATERFVKALLLDPQNATAKEFLRKISDQTSLTATAQSLKNLRFIDQIEYFNFLDLRYRSLASENSRLLEFVRNNFEKDPSLSQKLNVIESAQADHPIALPSVGIVGFEINDSKSVDMGEVIASLSRQKEFLLTQIGFWEEQNNQLRGLRRSILAQGNVQAPLVIADKLKSQLTEVENRTAQKDNLLATQNQNIEYFQSELSSVRENFSQLQERFKNTDLKISDLTKKLAEMSMEILEKDKILNEKDTYAAKLQQQISEANEKINLVQRIIQEKDDRIASLEKEMSQISMDVNAQSSFSNPEVAQLKKDFKLFEEQFKVQVERSRQRIIGLEMQFVDLTEKYQALVLDIQTRDFQISLLKGDLNKKDVSISQYREAFLTTNQKANELIGMVDIYRNKLLETKEMLLLKEKELNQLKGQVVQESPRVHPKKDSNQNNRPSEEFDLTFSKKMDQ